MSQEQKLKKIIEKAVENGFNISIINFSFIDFEYIKENISYEDLPIDSILFNHSFAKAFWGYEELCMFDTGELHNFKNCRCEYFVSLPAWQQYIQLLAITPDDERIDYLYKFIEEK